MCTCGQCIEVSTSEGTWCERTGIEIRGPEYVMHYSDHHSRSDRRGKLTAADLNRARTLAVRKEAQREYGPACLHGYVAMFLCHGRARQKARRARRKVMLPGILARLRPLIKASRTCDPSIASLIAAVRCKPFVFPVGLDAIDRRLPTLAVLLSRILSQMPTAKSKTAQRQAAVTGVATLLWKMGAAGLGEGDAILLPQPAWFHECSIPDTAYADFGVAHRAMTRQWLRVLKPICTRLRGTLHLPPE